MPGVWQEEPTLFDKNVTVFSLCTRRLQAREESPGSLPVSAIFVAKRSISFLSSMRVRKLIIVNNTRPQPKMNQFAASNALLKTKISTLT